MPKFRVPLRVIEIYDVEITADSPEEATRIAVEAAQHLSPDDSAIEVGRVEDLTPPSPQRLEAAYDLLLASEMPPMQKQAKALNLLHEVKRVLELSPGDDGFPEGQDRDRLEFLQSTIFQQVMGSDDGLPDLPTPEL